MCDSASISEIISKIRMSDQVHCFKVTINKVKCTEPPEICYQ